jgi:hypothetical protein
MGIFLRSEALDTNVIGRGNLPDGSGFLNKQAGVLQLPGGGSSSTPQAYPCRSQCFLWRVFEAAATAHIVLDSGLHVITHKGFSKFG